MFLSLIFFIDFLRRFISAPSKSKYFVRQLGWADLLASLPFPQLKLLRVFRLIKTYNITKQIGIKKAFRNFFRDRASSALYLILFTIILLLQFGSIAILYIEEGNPEANIKTASDAIWWVYVTITTVGYGDQFPVTNQGRALGMLVMFVGVGMFGVMTGFLANKFLPPSEAESNQETDIKQLKADIAEIKSLLKK